VCGWCGGKKVVSRKQKGGEVGLVRPLCLIFILFTVNPISILVKQQGSFHLQGHSFQSHPFVSRVATQACTMSSPSSQQLPQSVHSRSVIARRLSSSSHLLFIRYPHFQHPSAHNDRQLTCLHELVFRARRRPLSQPCHTRLGVDCPSAS